MRKKGQLAGRNPFWKPFGEHPPNKSPFSPVLTQQKIPNRIWEEKGSGGNCIKEDLPFLFLTKQHSFPLHGSEMFFLVEKYYGKKKRKLGVSF